MADLTDPTACCTPAAQETCCEPAAKDACCTPDSTACGCAEGEDIREVVRRR